MLKSFVSPILLSYFENLLYSTVNIFSNNIFLSGGKWDMLKLGNQLVFPRSLARDDSSARIFLSLSSYLIFDLVELRQKLNVQ